VNSSEKYYEGRIMEYDYHKKSPMCAEEIPLTAGEYSWSIYAFTPPG
jgi:hypothetical protein